MNSLFIFQNLDLLSVGFAVAATVVLGFAVYFNNSKSITNKTLLWFTVVTAAWGTVNYFSFRIENPAYHLWSIRLVMFFAVWQAYTLFLFMYVFPKESFALSVLVKYYLTFAVIITSILTLTPFVFSGIKLAPLGQVSQPIPNWGIVIFGIVTVSLVISGIVLFLRKFFTATSDDRRRFRPILIGSGLMFLLIIVFNFIAVAVFNTNIFIPLGALFVFPFIAFTSYAILKHKLFNVRAVWAGVLVFFLSVFTFSEVVLTQLSRENIPLIILRSAVFMLVLIFGVLLIRGIMREVEQREQLEALNKKLEELDQLKSEFLSFASHQIKSPMAVIKGFASLILEGGYGEVPPQIREVVLRIKESVDRLIVLVNNFLDLRKIEQGKMDIQLEDLDIVALTESIVEELKMVAVSKNLQLDFSSTLPNIKIKADEQKLRQVIQNLIDNAIKYTEAGWIKVKVETIKEDVGVIRNKESAAAGELLTVLSSAKESVLISVADSGRGMPAELLPQLFNRFTRDKKVAKAIQGTGLGLYIAKYIIDAHGGEIWAESPGEGKGSTFFIKLPISK
jgi:signal transduction histidine kinase